MSTQLDSIFDLVQAIQDRVESTESRIQITETKNQALEKRIFQLERDNIMKLATNNQQHLNLSSEDVDTMKERLNEFYGNNEAMKDAKVEVEDEISKLVMEKLVERGVDDRCREYWEANKKYHHLLLNDLDNPDLPPRRNGDEEGQNQSPYWMHIMKRCMIKDSEQVGKTQSFSNSTSDYRSNTVGTTTRDNTSKPFHLIKTAHITRDTQQHQQHSASTYRDSFTTHHTQRHAPTQATPTARVCNQLEKRKVDKRCYDFYMQQKMYHPTLVDQLENEQLPPGRAGRDESAYWTTTLKKMIDLSKGKGKGKGSTIRSRSRDAYNDGYY